MMAGKELLCGGVEAGGTRFVCAVGTGPDSVSAKTYFPTTTPTETLERVLTFFRVQPMLPDAIGVGSFGPLVQDPNSPLYGFITNTPKPGWTNIDVAGTLTRELNVKVAFDTDTGVAVLGESLWGAAQGLRAVLYLTVGTGIGGSCRVDGKSLPSLFPPEMGHIMIPRVSNDEFEGICPFHGDCLEGLASGSAIKARWGEPSEKLPADHPAWELEAQYLAVAIANYIGVLAPQRILLGGGVMNQTHLFPLIRRKVQEILKGYVNATELVDEIDAYIMAPALGEDAGVLGALALARETFLSHSGETR